MSASRAAQGLLFGAALGGLLAAADGLLCGLLLAGPTGSGVVAWTGWFALAGATVGGLMGVAVGIFGTRLILRPPESESPSTKTQQGAVSPSGPITR